MKCRVIGIDLAKKAMQVCALGTDQQILFNKKVTRGQLVALVMQLDPTAVIAMEACATAHHWARQFRLLGREVVLLPAQYVKPLVGPQKNDARDAIAICEAALRPRIHRVSVKTVEQQDIQSLRRIRQRHVDNRTALGNQIRGLSGEYGVSFSLSLSKLRIELTDALEDADNELSAPMREQLRELYRELLHTDGKVKQLEKTLQSLLKPNRDYARLRDIPGIGLLTGSALVSELGDGKRFKNGREVSAWCGLVPRQRSSGEREQLLGITKNGDRELRTLLIHCARAVIFRMKNQDNPMGKWLKALIKRRGIHKAIVALANKLGRIAWAVLRHGQPFEMKRAFGN